MWTCTSFSFRGQGLTITWLGFSWLALGRKILRVAVGFSFLIFVSFLKSSGVKCRENIVECGETSNCLSARRQNVFHVFFPCFRKCMTWHSLSISRAILAQCNSAVENHSEKREIITFVLSFDNQMCTWRLVFLCEQSIPGCLVLVTRPKPPTRRFQTCWTWAITIGVKWRCTMQKASD